LDFKKKVKNTIMENNKMEEIVDIINNIPNEKWMADGYTELNGKKISIRAPHSGYSPCIVIDDVDIYDKGCTKVWEIYNRVSQYLRAKESEKEKNKIDEIYNLLIA